MLLAEAVSLQIPINALLALGEYVGANERLSPEEIEFFSAWAQSYRGLYRWWSDHDPSTPVEELQAQASVRPYIAATRDLDVVERFAEDNGFGLDEMCVTQFDGWGFDPHQILHEGLKQHSSHKEADFLRQVLANNEYQAEIVVIRLESPLKKISLV